MDTETPNKAHLNPDWEPKGCHIHAVLVEAPVEPGQNWESTGISEKIIADTVLSQEALSGLTPGELTTTTARGKAAAGQLREAKNGAKAETKTDNHGRPERKISPSQGPDGANPPSRAGKEGLPGPHWVTNLSEFSKKDGSVGAANPSFGAGNGDLRRPNGKDHTALVLEPQEKGTAEGVEKVDLIIAPATGQIQATEGRPQSPIISHTKALGRGAASSEALVARGDSQNLGAGNLGPHRSKGRLNDPQKGPTNEEVLAVGMPGGQARGKIPQRRDEEQGKDNGKNKRGKLGKHRKGDGGDERGKPGGQSKRDDEENEHERARKVEPAKEFAAKRRSRS